MALITRQSIEDVRLRADIVALIGDYTTLKKSGSSWKGLSPFAAEKTPSFHVHPDKGFFHCFSTNQGGDIFRFLMIKEGLNFQESIERVASRFGITLQYEEGSGATREDRSLRAQLFALHETVTAHYVAAFKDKSAHANLIREYWQTKRNFSLEVADQFQIGFAPVNGGAIAALLLKSGYTKDALAKSGLFVGVDYSPDPQRWKARFRGRLMIPIRDVQGRIVAFTARQLELTPKDDPSHEAKYVNSPETEIFHKSHILFNLDKARKHASEERPIVLVEGQLDAIRSYTCGITTAVASQGTAIGEEHMALIRRFTHRLDALLDADRAGQAAAMKLLPIAMRSGIDVRVLGIPGGKDPDDYFSQTGPDGWSTIQDSAVSAINFAVRGLLPAGIPHSTAQKLEALQSLYGIIAQAESAVAQEEALGEICRLAMIDRVAVQRDFTRYRQTEKNRRQGQSASPEQPATTVNSQTSQINPPPLTTAEDALLIIALQHEEIAHQLAHLIQPELIENSTTSGKLLNRIFGEIAQGDWLGSTHALELADSDDERNYLSRLLANPFEIPDVKSKTNECLRVLLQRFVEKRRSQIDVRIAMLASNDLDTLKSLQEERIMLRKTLQNPPELP
ncbi:MAG: DNA primase [Puniceicoccales bacterium]|nr:DNA primase [Puniceicoccales bacterium]